MSSSKATAPAPPTDYDILASADDARESDSLNHVCEPVESPPKANKGAFPMLQRGGVAGPSEDRVAGTSSGKSVKERSEDASCNGATPRPEVSVKTWEPAKRQSLPDSIDHGDKWPSLQAKATSVGLVQKFKKMPTASAYVKARAAGEAEDIGRKMHVLGGPKPSGVPGPANWQSTPDSVDIRNRSYAAASGGHDR